MHLSFVHRFAIIVALATVSLVSAAGPTSAAAPAKPVDPFAAAAKNLSDDNPMVRRQAVDRLGRLRDPRGIPLLLKALDDEHPFVRSSIVNVLGRLRAADAKSAILSMLRKDKDAQVRMQAAVALAYFGDPAAVEPLIEALDDESNSVRYAAARTLGNLPSQSAIKTLEKKLAKDKDAGMRQAAAGALGRLGSKDSAKTLRKALKDADPRVRRESVKALGTLRDTDSIEAIKPLLENSDEEMRIQAVLALGRCGDYSGEPAAVKMLVSSKRLIRQLATNFLGEYGSKKTGFPALKKAAEKENDPAAKRSMGFALTQMKARLGIQEPRKKKKKR